MLHAQGSGPYPPFTMPAAAAPLISPPLPRPQLRLEGLMGGHSGICIHEDRGNAVQLMARAVTALLVAAPGTRLAEIKGGDKRNAIAREATAVIMVRTR